MWIYIYMFVLYVIPIDCILCWQSHANLCGICGSFVFQTFRIISRIISRRRSPYLMVWGCPFWKKRIKTKSQSSNSLKKPRSISYPTRLHSGLEKVNFHCYVSLPEGYWFSSTPHGKDFRYAETLDWSLWLKVQTSTSPAMSQHLDDPGEN